MNDGQGSHLMIENYRIPWIQIPAVPLRVKSLPSSKTHLLCKRGKFVSIPWDFCELMHLTHMVDVASGGQNGGEGVQRRLKQFQFSQNSNPRIVVLICYYSLVTETCLFADRV